MTILVTGATGHLGALVIDRLLARGTAPAEIVAGARSPEKAAALEGRGIRVATVDYDEPATIAAALDGVDRVVLVSGSEVGKRAAQHAAVIDAASAAGVELLVYTSIYHATENVLPLAAEHVETERLIGASGIPAAILRNNWYTENYAADLARAKDSGQIIAAAGEGHVASAARIDYADAAAVVVTSPDQAGRVYELAGDTAWSYAELAEAAAEVLGRDVAYVPVAGEQLAQGLLAAGLDEGTAGFVAALDAGIAQGALDSDDRTLAGLIGRPTTPLAEALRATLQG